MRLAQYLNFSSVPEERFLPPNALQRLVYSPVSSFLAFSMPDRPTDGQTDGTMATPNVIGSR